MSLPEHHPYGTARSQFGELFLPDGDGPFPVAVLIHGGFWRARHGRKQSRPLCADLAARGWAAWNVEYRRLGDGGGFPRTLDDVAAAVDHLTEVPAHRPGALDLSRVVAIGHSAGGHLAAWLATREVARVPVTGVVAQAGVLDLRMASALALSDGVVHELLGGTPGRAAGALCARVARRAAPARRPGARDPRRPRRDRAARDQRGVRRGGATPPATTSSWWWRPARTTSATSTRGIRCGRR